MRDDARMGTLPPARRPEGERDPRAQKFPYSHHRLSLRMRGYTLALEEGAVRRYS